MAACAYQYDNTQKRIPLSKGTAAVSNADHQQILPVPKPMDTIPGGDGRKGETSSSMLAAGAASAVSTAPTISTPLVLDGKIHKPRGKKRVGWGRIHTREFALVVGDHPMCQDGLPVSLGWQYDDHSCSAKNMNAMISGDSGENNKATGGGAKKPAALVSAIAQQQQKQQQPDPIRLSERRQSYVFPRRLSYEERRDRLISVSNLTLDQIKSDEINLVLRTLNESWEEDDRLLQSGKIIHHDSTIADQHWMQLQEMDVVPSIDVNFSNDHHHSAEEDIDFTNFEWTDNTSRSNNSTTTTTTSTTNKVSLTSASRDRKRKRN